MVEYIERGALMQFPIRRNHYDRKNGNKHFINGIESVLEYAENLPTADVVPVVHGRWIYKGDSDMWVCSRCGRGVNTNPEGIDLYCYHCGAKMDEKVDE